MHSVGRLISIIAVLFLPVSAANGQTPSALKGAAEKSGKDWPYPEPAVPGATGASPDYADYNQLSERWDIYANLWWRRTASRRDRDYYDGEIRDFLRTIPT